jgi:hypothetical protein
MMVDMIGNFIGLGDAQEISKAHSGLSEKAFPEIISI